MKLFIMSIISSLLLTSYSAPSYSQTTQDKKAQDILKAVSAKYNSLKSMSAQFRIISEDQKQKTSETQSGSLVVKGNKYKLTLKGQDVISDGNTSWTYLKESNEVQVNEIIKNDDAITPANIFTIYEKGFSSKYIGEKKIDNVQIQQIELIPDDAKKTFFKIQIHVNKAEKIITSAKIFERNGTIFSYVIDKFKTNVEAPESMFVFDKSKYPGIEVVDLR
jgi:outer membrane lipoprotein-sorting protein